MITWADVVAKIAGVVHIPAYTLYSVCGTGVGWNVGYPFDLGDALEQAGLIEHQPIGYPATAFPMQPSIDAGVAELVKQIMLRDPSEPWAMVGYSQGAIVTSTVYDRVRDVNDPLNAYAATFLGGVTFGNPRREEGHTVPGGIDPGGHGIVTPNLVNSEAKWWDFADGKAMVGSPGNDLYTTCGSGTSAATVADQEAIWTIVDEGSFSSFLGLAKKILEILPSPIAGGLAAIEAAVNALDFFVVEGITPHTSYQFVQPVAGDPRDCWTMALDYLTSLAVTPAPVAITAAVHPVAAVATGIFAQQEETPMTTPAPAINVAAIETELKEAVDGLLKGLVFVQKFESIIPEQYRGALDTAVKVLTVVDGVL